MQEKARRHSQYIEELQHQYQHHRPISQTQEEEEPRAKGNIQVIVSVSGNALLLLMDAQTYYDDK